MNHDIEQAIETFRCRAAKYAKNERYYRGDHDLAFATEKFANAFGSLFREFALNLCPAVCDAVKDKLRITGFSADNVGRPAARQDALGPDAAQRYLQGAETLARIWNMNQMDFRAGEVHKEALRAGDAYVIVWPGAEGQAVMYPNRASSCIAFYDDETPGEVTWAAKYWRTHDKRIRLNLFYPDRIERYVSKDQTETLLYDAKDLIALSSSDVGEQQVMPFEPGTIPNPYGVVPVFHFANNSEIGTPGVSELAAAIPIQDGLNKSVLDMLVAMEYSAYRQRWVTGIELETDEATGELIAPFRSGVEHVWTSENPEARFGYFISADLE